MSSNTSTGTCTSGALVRKLCVHLTKQPDESVSSTYRFVLRALSTAPAPQTSDEFVTIEKIKKKLVREGRQKDALTFSDLCRKLQNSTMLKNRCSVLTLLLNLCGTNKQYDRYAQFASELARIAAGSPDLSIHPNDIIYAKPPIRKNKITEELCSENWKESRESAFHEKESINGDIDMDFKSRVAHVTALFSKKEERQQQQVTWSSIKKEKEPSMVSKAECDDQVNVDLILQRELLRDILYSVQGISASDVSWQTNKNNFSVTVKNTVPNSARKMVLRFAELGWMYLKITQFCTAQNMENTKGLVAQSFVAALQVELQEYYRILATLQAQLNLEMGSKGNDNKFPLTLHRLSLWFLDPFLRLKVLSALVDACAGKRGGALSSVLFSHLQHGDLDIQSPVKHLLKTAIQPFHRILNNWIFCGELEDAFGEFFVTANSSVPDNNMWQEKYSLNKAMIPSFFSMDQAKKILSTGKAINFLRQVCRNHSYISENELLKKKHDAKKVESLFTQENDGEFQLLLEENYRKTSSLVLNVLHNEYELMQHFQAMRDYFLLGQGDFIRHLMDLLDDELAKPASSLYIHNLSGILESAIRATNAQYHNPDILQRLDVRLLEVSLGDSGWDVFSLDYHVDGPLGTIFTPQRMTLYLRLFNNLWRAKRMEYLLSNISQSRTMYLKIQERIPQVQPITFQCHIILAQMVHFVQQMQYYVAFEVMECSWADLLHKINIAHDLDQVISAHEMFLDTLITRSFLDEASEALRSQLKAIYDLILQFQKVQEKFWTQASSMIQLDDEQELCAEQRTDAGSWGVDTQQSKEYQIQLDQLIKTGIPTTKAKLRVLSYSYEDMVQKFLLMLNDHDDPNLRFLSFRLDFNEHFKNRNKRLHTSLTYQHRRRSLKYM